MPSIAAVRKSTDLIAKSVRISASETEAFKKDICKSLNSSPSQETVLRYTFSLLTAFFHFIYNNIRVLSII